MTDAVIGVDVGGTGSRVVVERDGQIVRSTSGPAGTSQEETFDAIVDAVRLGAAIAESSAVRAVGVGATRVATYFADLPLLRARLGEIVEAPTVIASDLVSTHLGALGGRAGATLAAGTGAVVLAEAEDGRLHRVDGWGHLLGDVGSGAWIGLRALAVGLAVHDGREPARGGLLAALEEEFGPAAEWARRMYESTDRARMAAALVPTVLMAADADDAHAAALLSEAADGLAHSIRAGLARPGVPPRVALAGGLLAVDRLRADLRAKLSDIVDVLEPTADSAEGALELARRAARGRQTPGGAGTELVSWP